MLCTLCVWQIPTEINPACNFHWHNGCDCITLLKVYCFLKGGGGEEGKGHAFISLLEYVNLLRYWISLLVVRYLSAKSQSGFAAGWGVLRTGVHKGQGPAVPPTAHCRDLCSQVPLPLGTLTLNSYVKSGQT